MSSGDLSRFSMLELLRVEVETQMGILSSGLVELESQPDSAELLKSLMRAAHSIKGAARIVNYDVGVRIAHAMEDRFVAAQEGRLCLGPRDIDSLLRGVDLITQLGSVEEADLVTWE